MFRNLKSRRVFYVGALAALLAFRCAVQAELLPVKTYTVADGALRDSVTRLRFDAQGFLWLCSAEGISRFDGYIFTNFTTADGLPDRHVNDFLQSRSGSFWVATDSGLARLNPKGSANSSENPRFVVFRPAEPLAQKITVLFEDDTGILAGTLAGLFRFSEVTGQFTLVDLGVADANGVLDISSIIADRRGALWVGSTTHALFRIDPAGAVEHFDKADGLTWNTVSALMEDNTGRIWVAFGDLQGPGLNRLIADPRKGRTIVEKVIERNDGVAKYWVTSVFQASDGKIWAGTAGGGMCRLGNDDKLDCERYKAANNLCDEQIWSITEDRDKNLWIGSKCGTKKWLRYGFTSYMKVDGLAHQSVASIFENSDGDLFASVGLARMPLSRFDDEKFKIITPNLPAAAAPGWGWRQTVWRDSVGDWWFPTAGGLYRFRNVLRPDDLGTATPEKVLIDNSDPEVFRLFEDSRRDIWVQTYADPNELWRWERATGRWIDHTRDAGISAWRMATAFVEDRLGNLWIATGGDRDEAALIRYRDGRFDVFTRDDNELIAGWLRDLYLDEANRLWIASNSTGLLRLDDLNTTKPEFVRYTTREGLSSTGVYSVTGDQFGRIYVGSGRGVDRLDPATGQVENFTTDDGLPSAEVWTSYRDKKNNLWFATTQGLARYVPEPPRIRRPPSAFISAFRVLGEPRPVSMFGEPELPNIDLAADQQQVTIEFLGLGSNIGEKLNYEYRLSGAEWAPAEGRSVNLATLAAGVYRFEVRAVTADKLFSQPALATFSIAAPLWQRWWFLSAVAAFLAALVYWLYRARLRRAIELERVRTRIATDLHDDIGANLTRIALLSEMANQQAANGRTGEMLKSVANIARESVASMSDIVWAVSPDHDSLRDLVSRMRRHAEEVFAALGIELEFYAPPSETYLKLSVGVRRDLLLIFKEAVNNAARHSACTRASIDFRLENGKIKLAVSDNGKGFDPKAEYEGQGLRSMHRRAESLGGRLDVAADNGKGTSARFEMPL